MDEQHFYWIVKNDTLSLLYQSSFLFFRFFEMVSFLLTLDTFLGTSGKWKSAGGAAAVPAAGDGTSQPVCSGTYACLLQCYHTHTAE